VLRAHRKSGSRAECQDDKARETRFLMLLSGFQVLPKFNTLPEFQCADGLTARIPIACGNRTSLI
jgi:hypothetical protein